MADQTNKKIAVLGATGSIGAQALKVVDEHPELFTVHTLTANTNARELGRLIKKYSPVHAVIANPAMIDEVKWAAGDTVTQLHAGKDALEEVVTMPEIDVVLTALVGFAGLMPTVNAIKEGKTIALANKETLAVAGELIMPMAKSYGAPVYPVDSEHSAIFQALQGEGDNTIEKIYLTASGGPFRNKSREFLRYATREQALAHPTWSMGAKITIDSASMMNKGLEVIEARWLFNLAPHQIDVIIHPQSVIHSIVQFIDGSMKAQMGMPDMRLPIQYAMGFPNRIKSTHKRFCFAEYPELSFEKPDMEKFRNLAIAYQAMKRGGNIPCIMNAANEVAVDAFLNNKLTFLQIARVIEDTITASTYQPCNHINDYKIFDTEARKTAGKLIKQYAAAGAGHQAY